MRTHFRVSFVWRRQRTGFLVHRPFQRIDPLLQRLDRLDPGAPLGQNVLRNPERFRQTIVLLDCLLHVSGLDCNAQRLRDRQLSTPLVAVPNPICRSGLRVVRATVSCRSSHNAQDADDRLPPPCAPSSAASDPPVVRAAFPKIKLTFGGAKPPAQHAVSQIERWRPRIVTLRLPHGAGGSPRASSVASPARSAAGTGAVEEYSEEEDGDDDVEINGSAAFADEDDDDVDMDGGDGDAGFPRIGGFPRVDAFPTIDARTPGGGIDPRIAFGGGGKTSTGSSSTPRMGTSPQKIRILPPAPVPASPSVITGSDVGSESSMGTGTRDGLEDQSQGGDLDPGLASAVSVPGQPPKKKARRGRLKLRKPKGSLADGHVRKPKVLPKRPITGVLLGIVAKLRRHDAYGFFWTPVDRAQVPEYYKVITNPMDFETMTKKIEAKQYPDIAAFKSDFQLVVDNCRTFNPPQSAYHKAANKLEAYGNPLIERESNAVYTLAESIELNPEEAIPITHPEPPPPPPEPVEAAPTPVEPAPVLVSTPQTVAHEEDYRSRPVPIAVPQRKKYEKRPKFRRFDGYYNLDTDGSLRAEDDDQAWAMVPPATRWERFLDTHHRLNPLDIMHVDDVQRIPDHYPRSGDNLPMGNRLPETRFTAAVYGSAAGQAYVESLLAFAEGAGPAAAAFARRRAAELTRGASELVHAVVDHNLASSWPPKRAEEPLPLPADFQPYEEAIRQDLAPLKREADTAALHRIIELGDPEEIIADLAKLKPQNVVRPGSISADKVKAILEQNNRYLKLMIHARQNPDFGAKKNMTREEAARQLSKLDEEMKGRAVMLGSSMGLLKARGFQ